ncbi:hypothetical protein IWQ51_006272 [Labrenzia sp. EL_142]|nr:hypothetical protein [Labrenzia sp. EL_142]
MKFENQFKELRGKMTSMENLSKAIAEVEREVPKSVDSVTEKGGEFVLPYSSLAPFGQQKLKTYWSR